jgi:HCOMODA/2-hydroxy-3-carboxy-muconic semialdehyde decarboxylase
MSVCHNHARSLIPFGITGTAIRPVLHVAGSIGAEVPIWDVRDEFGDTDLLVTTSAIGGSLARALGRHRVCLMRGHGAGGRHDLKATVFRLDLPHGQRGAGQGGAHLGEVTYLSEARSGSPSR